MIEKRDARLEAGGHAHAVLALQQRRQIAALIVDEHPVGARPAGRPERRARTKRVIVATG